MRYHVFESAQQVVDGRHRLGVGQLGGFDAVLDALATVHVRDHRGGQQFAVLHDVDSAVGEAAFVAQPHHAEFEVLLRVTTRDEMHRQRARPKLLQNGAAACHKGLCHHLATERPHRIAARVRADERVVVEAVEVQYRQQFLEVCR